MDHETQRLWIVAVVWAEHFERDSSSELLSALRAPARRQAELLERLGRESDAEAVRELEGGGSPDGVLGNVGGVGEGDLDGALDGERRADVLGNVALLLDDEAPGVARAVSAAADEHLVLQVCELWRAWRHRDLSPLALAAIALGRAAILGLGTEDELYFVRMRNEGLA